MKWVHIFSDSVSKDDDIKDDKVSFKKFDSEKNVIENSKIWAQYEFKELMSEQDKKSYKIFCGGYLQFYDTITRNGAIDHFIYFKWFDKKNANGHFGLLIYIGYDGMPKDLDINGNTIYLDPNKYHTLPPALTITKDPPPPPSPPPPPKGL